MQNNKDKQNPKSETSYTFMVYCSFKMQYTFSEDEVVRDLSGDGDDAEPTDEALSNLEAELEDHLFQMYPITEVDASADSNSLIAIAEFHLPDEEQQLKNDAAE